MEVRSYRRVFELERRIYRVDRLRLNPTGVPVRGVVYFLALLAGSLLASRLPGLALVAERAPWYVRDLAAPGALAALLAVVRIDGRPFHLAAHAIARFHIRPHVLVRLRPRRERAGAPWAPPPVLLLPDGSDARLRPFRYAGPGAVRVAAAHELRAARGPVARMWLRAHVRIRAAVEPAGAGQPRARVVVLARGGRLSVR